MGGEGIKDGSAGVSFDMQKDPTSIDGQGGFAQTISFF